MALHWCAAGTSGVRGQFRRVERAPLPVRGACRHSRDTAFGDYRWHVWCDNLTASDEREDRRRQQQVGCPPARQRRRAGSALPSAFQAQLHCFDELASAAFSSNRLAAETNSRSATHTAIS